MLNNILEGAGMILLSVLTGREWYKWRQNPNNKERIIAYNTRLFAVTTGFFIGGILLVIGYGVNSPDYDNFSPRIYCIVFILIGLINGISLYVKYRKATKSNVIFIFYGISIILILIGVGLFIDK